MYALLSGAAGVAALVAGSQARILQLNAEDEAPAVEVPISNLRQIFGGLQDVQRFENKSEEELAYLLRQRSAVDRTLRLVSLALEEDCEDGIIIDSLAIIDELIEDEQVATWVSQALFAVPLPDPSVLETVLSQAPQGGLIEKLLLELSNSQEAIQKVWGGWEAIPSDLFDGENGRDHFKVAAIASGVFKLFVSAILVSKPNEALFQAFSMLTGERNYRAILKNWIDAVGLQPTRAIAQTAEGENRPGERRSDDLAKPKFMLRRNLPIHSTFINVMHQQEVIERLLDVGQLVRAAAYARDLVQEQLRQTGGGQWAAKSLCRLAQHAKSRSIYSLQLDWTERATQLAPEDGWAHGQAADAYLMQNRLDEAVRELKLAEVYGEVFYARMGEARILRHQAKFTEALQAFRNVRKEFEDHENEFLVWLNEAEVLRDMWRLEDALSVYEQATNKFGGEVSLRCGLAAVLAQLGRQSDAIQAYTLLMHEIGIDEYALCGRAHVHLELGEFERAEEDYSRAAEQFPQSSVPLCGLAEVKRVTGAFEEALFIYKRAMQQFPTIVVPFVGYGAVLKDAGEYGFAIQHFKETVTRFPFDVRARNGLSNALQQNGELAAALTSYEETAAKFPFDIFSASGRAFMLRLFGRLDEAAQTYEAILERRPGFLRAQHGMASVRVLQRRYDDALSLISDKYLRTSDEWRGHHIRGMILLRTGQIDAAMELLQRGLIAVPYYRERAYFQNALAIARLSRGEFEAANQLVKPEGKADSAAILTFHALAGLRRVQEASSLVHNFVFEENSKIIELKQEIGRRYGVWPGEAQHTEQWIIEQECDVLLAA